MTSRSSSYKGDSPAKKFARAIYWLVAAENLPKTKLRDGLHLVLSSKDAGDIAALLALGVKPSAIIAVDQDPEAALAVLEEYPGVKSINDDVFDVARHYRGKLVSASFDLCNNVSLEIVDKMVEVVRWFPDQGYWGLSFSYGREGERAKADLVEMRKRILDWTICEAAKGYGIVTTDGFKSLEEYKTLMEVNEKIQFAPHEERAITVAHYIGWQLGMVTKKQPRMMGGGVRHFLQYKSTTEFSVGMPMFMIGNIVFKQTMGESKSAFVERVERDAVEPPRSHRIPADPHRFRLFVVDIYDILRDKGMNHKQVAQFFNIPTEQLNVWVGEQP